ncbi:MAG: DNA replication/repair protein RecF [Bacilli bacterium]|nr:DNA replication/repair protein RecF [Bacilli bacterium]
MILKKISLNNFRNYSKLELTFDKKINIFIGNNAQGKTNILEGIYVLSITKSHRCNKDSFLIKQNELFTKVNGEIVHENSLKKSYEVLINSKGKKVSINDVPFRKISDYLSNINTIMFCPDDLEILKGPPNNRRYFLNVEISQFYNNYLKYINDYNKVLKNRNEYLKNNVDKIDNIYFDIITNELIKLNIEILNSRKNYIDKINYHIKKIYKDLTGKAKIFVKYESFVDMSHNSKLFDDIKEKYDRVYFQELQQKTTLVGVHRDDFSIYLDDVKINNFGSQGQHRIAILCFKLAEIEMMKENKYVKPILLLDDIFSELDKDKKDNIIKYIDNDLQVFITSTDINNIDYRLIEKADVFYVENAKVSKRGERNG